MEEGVHPEHLIGRARECALLEDLSGGGVPVALVHGEAGIGKSALLSWVLERADQSGTRILYAAGTPAESDLPFAGLHQLLRPVLEDAGSVPPQRLVLSALQAREAAGAALFHTAMAVLHLLAELSSSQRVVVVVDDVQWLDRPSRDVLTFVGRRLGIDPVALLLAARDPVPAELEQAAVGSGWLVVPVPRLDESDSATLLDRTSSDLTPEARRLVLDEAAGSPLALLELPHTVHAATTATPGALPTQLPVNDRLEAAFVARLPALPATARSLVVLAAAQVSDDVGDLLAAGAELLGDEVTLDDLEAAVAAGLLTVDGSSVRFRHMLARSAVCQQVGPAALQAAHRALASTTRSPDRRAWHAAAAAGRPDESVAEQLDAVAERASHTGAMETAAKALEESARVSESPSRRATRVLRALELTFDLGQQERTLRLLADLDAAALDRAERIRLDWLRELLTEGAWSGGERVDSFTSVAERMAASGDTARAVEMLVGISLRCWWSNLDAETRTAVAQAADGLRRGPDDPAHLVVTALAAPWERGRDAVAALGRITIADLYPDSGLLLMLGLAATGVGDHPRGVTMLSAAIAESRRQGRTGVLTQALVAQAWAETHLGRLRRADVAAEEGIRLSQETGQPLWRATGELAYAAARGLRGETGAADALADRAERVLLGTGANPLLAQVQTARGLADLGAGRHEDGFAQLVRVFSPRDVSFHQYQRTFIVAELAEAAAHSARHDDARRRLADVEPLAELTGSPILRAGLLVARPLLAADDRVEELYEQALADGLHAWPLHRAKAHLGYGAWLRRQRRIAEARDPLRTARETFAALGAAPWAERASQELRAAGEPDRERPAAAWEELTSQEMQIASLAARGLTNRQIGERLFLSHRTIGAHLYHIFPKLGIASRAQLGTALAGVGASHEAQDAG